MRERGVVAETREGEVSVRIAKGEACETCGCCVTLGSGEMLLEGVLDPAGARDGDTVEVEMPERSRLIANTLL